LKRNFKLASGDIHTLDAVDIQAIGRRNPYAINSRYPSLKSSSKPEVEVAVEAGIKYKEKRKLEIFEIFCFFVKTFGAKLFVFFAKTLGTKLFFVFAKNSWSKTLCFLCKNS